MVEALRVGGRTVELLGEVIAVHRAGLVLRERPVEDERAHALPRGRQPDRLGLEQRGFTREVVALARRGVIEAVAGNPVLGHADAGGLRAVAREGDRREHRPEAAAVRTLGLQSREERQRRAVKVVVAETIHADPNDGGLSCWRGRGDPADEHHPRDYPEQKPFHAATLWLQRTADKRV